MKQKELTKTFMMIEKTHSVSMMYTKILQRFKDLVTRLAGFCFNNTQ